MIEGYKLIVGSKENLLRIIPIIAGVLGGGLGIGIYYIYPQMIPATDVVTAVIIGIASGLSATGTNQIFKQLITKSEEK